GLRDDDVPVGVVAVARRERAVTAVPTVVGDVMVVVPGVVIIEPAPVPRIIRVVPASLVGRGKGVRCAAGAGHGDQQQQADDPAAEETQAGQAGHSVPFSVTPRADNWARSSTASFAA